MSKLTLDVTKEINCDVLVVGGGCAGIAAAVCSARHGADTVLCEQYGFLGGTATAGLVGPFMTSYDAAGRTQLIRGFFDELVRRMEKEGGATHPSKATVGTAYTSYRVAGHKNCTAVNSEAIKRVSEQMCKESGVRLYYHMLLIAADRDGDRVTAAYFATKNGVYKVTAGVFIDCTGDADLAVRAGARTVFGDGNGAVQASSLFFKVRGVDKKLMDEHMAASPDMETKFYMKEIIAEREKGNFPLYRAKIMLFEGLGGEWIVNMSQIDDVDSTDPEQVTAAEITGREQIDYIIAFLKKYAAGCKNIKLCESAAALGVRESRRIVGVYEMTKEDAIDSVRFDDAVFCCSNSMDIHCKGYVTYIERKSDAPYYFPYRSLVSADASNLLAAGRCASAQREVMAAVRVMPPCFAMGQAAGTAAAMSAKSGVPAAEIDAAALVRTLIKDGVYLP